MYVRVLAGNEKHTSNEKVLKMRSSRKRLIYLHIPKCAGTSVKDWVKRNFDEYDVFIHENSHKLHNEPISRLLEKKVIIGHIKPYHRKIRAIELIYGKSNIVYGATVREPILQIASHVNYIKRNPKHPAYFEDSIESAIGRNSKFFKWQRNIQCSYFTWRRTFENAHRWISKRNVVIHPIEETHQHIRKLSSVMKCSDLHVGRHNRAAQSYEEILRNRALNEFVEEFCVEDKKLYEHVKGLVNSADADG